MLLNYDFNSSYNNTHSFLDIKINYTHFLNRTLEQVCKSTIKKCFSAIKMRIRHYLKFFSVMDICAV